MLVSAPVSGRPAGLRIRATVQWLYFEDMERIERFYRELLGAEVIVDQGWAKVLPASRTGFVGLVDGSRGLHQATEQKGVTVSFFTDDLHGWFEYVKESGAFELRSDELHEVGPRVQAFVGYDPEGYYLEFDKFLEHEDNEDLLESLRR